MNAAVLAQDCAENIECALWSKRMIKVALRSLMIGEWVHYSTFWKRQEIANLNCSKKGTKTAWVTVKHEGKLSWILERILSLVAFENKLEKPLVGVTLSFGLLRKKTKTSLSKFPGKREWTVLFGNFQRLSWVWKGTFFVVEVPFLFPTLHHAIWGFISSPWSGICVFNIETSSGRYLQS